jgi:hypothetical protein
LIRAVETTFLWYLFQERQTRTLNDRDFVLAREPLLMVFASQDKSDIEYFISQFSGARDEER